MSGSKRRSCSGPSIAYLLRRLRRRVRAAGGGVPGSHLDRLLVGLGILRAFAREEPDPLSALIEGDVPRTVLEEEGAKVTGLGDDGDRREDHNAVVEKVDGRDMRVPAGH